MITNNEAPMKRSSLKRKSKDVSPSKDNDQTFTIILKGGVTLDHLNVITHMANLIQRKIYRDFLSNRLGKVLLAKILCEEQNQSKGSNRRPFKLDYFLKKMPSAFYILDIADKPFTLTLSISKFLEIVNKLVTDSVIETTNDEAIIEEIQFRIGTVRAYEVMKKMTEQIFEKIVRQPENHYQKRNEVYRNINVKVKTKRVKHSFVMEVCLLDGNISEKHDA